MKDRIAGWMAFIRWLGLSVLYLLMAIGPCRWRLRRRVLARWVEANLALAPYLK